jgi:hypothetical protein
VDRSGTAPAGRDEAVIRNFLLFPLRAALAVACVSVILIATPILLLLEGSFEDKEP